jgi:hypothetical protein
MTPSKYDKPCSLGLVTPISSTCVGLEAAVWLLIVGSSSSSAAVFVSGSSEDLVSDTQSLNPVSPVATQPSCKPQLLDIGLSIDKRTLLSDNERLQLLETSWIAPDGFQWPYSERKDGIKIRKKYLGPQHLSGQYSVFAYSVMKQGVFCKPCALFAPDSVRGVTLDRLVKSPLQKYDHLTGKDGYLTSHLATVFHEDCLSRANALVETMRSSAGNISQQLHTSAAGYLEKNRRALGRIIQAIEYHGRLGLPLRGHRDSGELPLHDATAAGSAGSSRITGSNIDYTEGNLRALLQLMVECNDDVLKQHLATTGKNATYISPVSQNVLIESMSTVMQRKILAEVQQAKYFAVLADETTDFSQQEQLAVCLRYVKDFSICERFLCFAFAPDLTGAGLSSQLLSILDNLGIDIAYMVGQGYDGAAAMSGAKNGVQKHIADKCPSALYVHCAAHCLNLCLAKAADVRDIRAAVTLMNSVAVFFRDSNKRLLNLQMWIDVKCPESGRTRLKKQCTTRWVERQEAVLVFRELYPAVLSSLEDMSKWSGDTGSQCVVFLKAFDSSFVVSLEVLHTVLEVTKPLSVQLQGKCQDIYRASQTIQDCLTVLQAFREGSTFDDIFSRASNINGEDIEMPRLAKKQMNRNNVPADCAKDYYRRAVFLPFIDTCSGQLHERFQSHAQIAYRLSCLLPSLCEKCTFVDVEEAVKFYCHYLTESDGLLTTQTEFLRWKAYWARQPATVNRPDNVIDALRVASDLGTYPNITVLLHIFATIPVTTATGERSFSALKYIKNYLRSTMGEQRLNGLGHLFINRDITLDYDMVIDDFAKHSRRLKFV